MRDMGFTPYPHASDVGFKPRTGSRLVQSPLLPWLDTPRHERLPGARWLLEGLVGDAPLLPL